MDEATKYVKSVIRTFRYPGSRRAMTLEADDVYSEHRIVADIYGHDEKRGQDTARIRQAMRKKSEAR